ncbi:MAG: glycosyltransferase [Candidatus Omnitrophota bacterium]
MNLDRDSMKSNNSEKSNKAKASEEIKIIQILPHMNIGGVERGVLDLVKFFKTGNIKNIVISAGGRLVEELNKQGIRHYRLGVHRKSLLAFFLVPKLRKIIEKEKVDIVHARSRVPGWLGFFATRSSRAHFVTTAHGVYRNKFFSEVMGWGKYVICPSKIVARHMKINFGVSEEKIVIVNRWVDLDKFKFKDYQTRKESNTIVSIGRISPTKGYEYLIEGLKKVVRFNPYIKLKIIGSADKSKEKYLRHLKALVNRFSLSYNVEFVGFKQDIENILKDARILVAPSVIEESFGRVVIEAFACGVPVIASKIGGFEEVIENGRDGILAEPANSADISREILKILNEPEYAENLVNNARKKVEERYTMKECLRQAAEVYVKSQTLLKILVIKISSFGDLILSIPSLKEIRDKFPNAVICLLTLKKYYSFFYGCPYVNEVITLDDKYKKFKNILDITKSLRRKSFDYIVDLQNSRASHFISFLSFPRYSFGYTLRWGFLLSKRVKYNRADSPLISQERVLKLLGITFKEKKLSFWQGGSDIALTLPKAPLIGINVSASSRWQSKNWPVKNIVRLIELIQRNLPTYKVVLLGDEQAKTIAKKIENLLKSQPLNLCGKTTLKDLPQILEKLEVFVTPDTATLHLSCALNIPTIALFGPTDPNRHIVQSENIYIFCEKTPCSFCYRPKCGFEDKNLCLKKITAGQVFIKIKEILARKSQSL